MNWMDLAQLVFIITLGYVLVTKILPKMGGG